MAILPLRSRVQAVSDVSQSEDKVAMYSTPPCCTVYAIMGGVRCWAEMSNKKSGLLHDTIDGSDGFYACPVEKASRLNMDVPFTIGGSDEALEEVLG